MTPNEWLGAWAVTLALGVGGLFVGRVLRAGKLWPASLGVLFMASTLGFLNALSLSPAIERFHDRTRFFAVIGQFGGPRPLALWGGPVNEATWYLDRPVTVIRTFGDLEGFWARHADGLLLIREPEYLRLFMMDKKRCLHLIRIQRRGNTPFFLLEREV